MEMPRLQKKKDELSEDLISYIYNNYATVNLEEVSSHFHFSKQYCSKLIIELTGMSLSDLRTQLRLRRGVELLSHTSMSVEDISSSLGYENPETFIRAFKRERGVTPGSWRKLHSSSKMLPADKHVTPAQGLQSIEKPRA